MSFLNSDLSRGCRWYGRRERARRNSANLRGITGFRLRSRATHAFSPQGAGLRDHEKETEANERLGGDNAPRHSHMGEMRREYGGEHNVQDSGGQGGA